MLPGPRTASISANRSSRPFSRQFRHERFPGVAVGHGEVGEMVFAELKVEIAPFGDLDGVRYSLGDEGEGLLHFFRGFHVKGLGRESQPVRVLDDLAGLDAEERVMRLVVLHVQVMTVVCGDDGDARVPRQFDELPVHYFLLGDAVVLELEVKVFLAQYLFIFEGGPLCVLVPALDQKGRDLSAQAGRQADESFAVRPEEVLVYPGFVVEALEVCGGNELDEVFIALPVPRKENKVIRSLLILARGRAFIESGARRHVDFAPDDGLDPGLGGLQIEVESGE